MIDKETILKDSLSNNVFSVSEDLDNAFIFTLSDLHIGMGNMNYIREIVKFIEIDGRIAVNCFTCIKGMDLSKQYGKPKKK